MRLSDALPLPPSEGECIDAPLSGVMPHAYLAKGRKRTPRFGRIGWLQAALGSARAAKCPHGAVRGLPRASQNLPHHFIPYSRIHCVRNWDWQVSQSNF